MTDMMNKVKTKKVYGLKHYKDKAWAACSKWVRQSNADEEGMCICYTCENLFHYKQIQAGHGIPSRTNAVLFMTEVIRPQCLGCNFYGGGKYKIFTKKLIEEYGEEKYAQLVIQSNQTIKYSKEDYQRIEQDFKDRLSNL